MGHEFWSGRAVGLGACLCIDIGKGWGGYGVAAGVKQQLMSDAERVTGLRLLEGRFMVIEQAMGIPKGRPAGAEFLSAFLRTMIESGFVANAIRTHGAKGALVAPLSSKG